jgi:Family of unknown function (DUF6505)
VSILKLPRAIRLDPSDTLVYARAAEPGEWLVSGAFRFDPGSIDELDAKSRAALRGGFMGITSFGWSTLAVVTLARDDEREAATGQLAQAFRDRLGAPDLASAHAAAMEEITFAASLCDHPPETILAVHRVIENGGIIERFRTLTPRGDRPSHAPRAFQFVETDDEGPLENVDLLALHEDKN